MAKLIKKNAITPKKGEFYYVKNGSIYAAKPNRSGGKKGRKVCGTKKKSKKRTRKTRKR